MVNIGLVTVALSFVLSFAVARADEGVSNGAGAGRSKAAACTDAKRGTDVTKPSGSTITEHTTCDCSQDGTSMNVHWICTVSARWKKSDRN
jgi:hypothetical protein